MEKAAGDKLGVLSAVFCCFLHGAPYSAGKSGEMYGLSTLTSRLLVL